METSRETASRAYTVHVPKKDVALFRSITARMGWTSTVQKQKRPQLDRAFDEVCQGKLYDAEDAADVMRQCLG